MSSSVIIIMVYTISTVTLRGNATYQFRGFLIQARVVGSSPERADGEFVNPATSVSTFHNCDSTQVY